MQINVILGRQPVMPAHMGPRVGRAADPYQKQGGRRAGADPNGQKADKSAVRFGHPGGDGYFVSYCQRLVLLVGSTSMNEIFLA